MLHVKDSLHDETLNPSLKIHNVYKAWDYIGDSISNRLGFSCLPSRLRMDWGGGGDDGFMAFASARERKGHADGLG